MREWKPKSQLPFKFYHPMLCRELNAVLLGMQCKILTSCGLQLHFQLRPLGLRVDLAKSFPVFGYRMAQDGPHATLGASAPFMLRAVAPITWASFKPCERKITGSIPGSFFDVFINSFSY